jgi:hypothetical protein
MTVQRREVSPAPPAPAAPATVVAFTVSFSGVNLTAAPDINVTLPPAVVGTGP